MDTVIHGNPYYHLFKWRRFTASLASTASGGRTGCSATAFTHTTASGDVIPYSMIQEIDGQEYIAIGLRGFYGGNGNLSFRHLHLLYPYLHADNMTLVRNSSTSTLSGKTVYLDVVLMKKPPDAMIYEVLNGQFARRVDNGDGTQSLVVINDGD